MTVLQNTTARHEYVWQTLSSKHDFPFDITDMWQVEGKFDFSSVKLPLMLHTIDMRGSSVGIYHNQETESKADGFLRVIYSGYSIRVQAIGKSEKIARSLIKVIRAIVPEQVENKNDGTLQVKFWYQGPGGPTNVSRKIDVPAWDDIITNYSRPTREGLGRLFNEFEPSHGGQVILWHGHPGTGKTYALRALARAWKSWCSSEYIIDPEILFGGTPAYLTSLVLNNVGDEEMWDNITEDYIIKSGDEKWKLIILEDTGELISEDAKERTGQGLSRLLNLADGILGQGLKVIILITTNEPLAKLHPAVSRPGRCASVVEFTQLNRGEIESWNNHHNKKVGLISGTIAEVYAEAEDFEIKTTNLDRRKKLGFSAA